MTSTAPLIPSSSSPLAAFAAALALFALLEPASSAPARLRRSTGGAPRRRRLDRRSRSPRSSATLRERPARRRRATPRSATPTCRRSRETGDAVLLRRAAGRARRRRCGATRATPARSPGTGPLALARHDFAAACATASAPTRAAPEVVQPLRRDRRRAGRARPLRRRRRARCSRWSTSSRTSPPTRASRTSASCTATCDGAREAMRLAVSAGGDAPENARLRADAARQPRARRAAGLGRGRDAYRHALARFPGYVPAEAGLARVDAAAGTSAPRSRALPRASSRGCRCPSTSIALGETELAAGRDARPRAATSRSSVPSSGCCSANGVNTDAELAVFEADHGTPARAVALGRRAWAAGAERALGRRARLGADARRQAGQGLRWAQRALRLGSATRCSSTTPAWPRAARATRPGARLSPERWRQPALLAALRAAGAAGSEAARPLGHRRVRGVRELAEQPGHHECDLLADVHGVVADALEGARHQHHRASPTRACRGRRRSRSRRGSSRGSAG